MDVVKCGEVVFSVYLLNVVTERPFFFFLPVQFAVVLPVHFSLFYGLLKWDVLEMGCAFLTEKKRILLAVVVSGGCGELYQ